MNFTHLDTQDIETTESFFSDQFLSARIHGGTESNEGYDPIFELGRDDDWPDRNWAAIKENDMKYDEDVNQYITLTLAELAHPQTLPLINKYLVSIKSDVGQEAVDFADRSKKYLAYKVNADFLLLNLGLFHPDSNLLGHAYFDKGETYYYSAATHLKAIKGGRSGLSDVMEKLSGRFGKYVEILRTMKNRADNYFSFHVRIPEAELKRFENELAREAAKRHNPPSP
ncbi:MAG: hypothetical protein E2O42_00030 [Nitrospina sp.]|nr:MAG: hypothetical protein E2O43_06770 [Nitrospina sp.]TDJ62783.1 MAG: hypothetical protein E2O42_00030 [Nitrospina sp.]